MAGRKPSSLAVMLATPPATALTPSARSAPARVRTRAATAPRRSTAPRNWRHKFLAELAAHGNRKLAAEVAGIDRQTAYNLRNSDPEFRAAWDAAIDKAAEVLEEEAWRRATDGWDEEVYQLGQYAGTVRRYSDRLLEFLLRGARPAKYRENVKHEHSGPDGRPIAFSFQAVVAELTAGSGADREDIGED